MKTDKREDNASSLALDPTKMIVCCNVVRIEVPIPADTVC
jgi:hypothetical protein